MNKIHIRKRLLPILALVILAIGALGFFGFKSGLLLTENQKFERFTNKLFTEEVSANTLNLHYTLAYPKKYGIKDYPISIGSLNAEDMPASYAVLENHKNALQSFTYKKLSETNQMTYDILKLDMATQLSLKDNYMLSEVLSPSLGIQAQLPVLLAEYTFRTKQDIDDYLGLLSSISKYFEEIIAFEQEKSKQGLFMSDTTVDRIVAQCQAFISQVTATPSGGTLSSDTASTASSNTSENYLSTMFQEKLQDFGETLSSEQMSSYIISHQKIMDTQVIPAYTNLINALSALKGTGQNENGLSYFPKGTDYYRYLIRNNTGDYNTLDHIEKRLYKQLLSDYEEMQKLITANPSLISKISDMASMSTAADTTSDKVPNQMLETLKSKIQVDFPEIEDPVYEVKYVHPSLEEFLSPAFYLTPPIDTGSPNVIYINNGSQSSQADLFTTLAHEGFPGHLYQTLYFSQSNPSKIRYLMSYGGYVEGWATYVESYAYDYLDSDPALTRFLWLNRSINLCLYSIMDMGIHYRGWTSDVVTKYLSTFGITDTAIAQEIFQYIVENPANYLKYYMGYLNFADIRDEAKEKEGDAFNIKKFHEKVLTLGPSQFPILRKYILKES